MASFLVKYVVDGTIKTTQGDRNHQSFAAIKAAIQKGSGKSNFNLRYAGASGDINVADDASLKAALSDAEKTKKPYLRLVVA